MYHFSLLCIILFSIFIILFNINDSIITDADSDRPDVLLLDQS